MEQDHYSVTDKDVSQEKRRPWARLSGYLHDKLNLGASVESTLAILDELRQQVKAWAGAIRTLPLAVAFRREVETQATADVSQQAATLNPTAENLEIAIRDTDAHIAAAQECRDVMYVEMMRLLNGVAPSPVPPRRCA